MLAKTILTLAIGGTVACSASDGSEPASGLASGGPSGGTGGGGASGGGPGVGGAAGTAGAGAGLGLDAGGSGGSGTLPPDGACTGVTEATQNGIQVADIIFAVDNSASMTEEIGFVQQHLNAFSSSIVQANPALDPHVILISNPTSEANGMCVAAPLGSGACPNDDHLPGFFHVDHYVDSDNPLDLFVDLFDEYSPSLRKSSTKHFVVVTDDNEKYLDSATFDAKILEKLVGFGAPADYTFHGVYAFTKPDPGTCLVNPASDPCCLLFGSIVAAPGKTYAELVQMTGGIAGNLCAQDFGPVFAEVSTAVVSSSHLACEWAIPPPPDGQTLDPTQVNLQLTLNGSPAPPLGYVDSPADCGKVQGGWYYDDPLAPTRVFVCSDVCLGIQSADSASIEIQFGCARVPATPR
jgi:hypothetical protein